MTRVTRAALFANALAIGGVSCCLQAGAASFPKAATKAQVQTCVIAVTGKKSLTKKQVNACLATVMQTYVAQSCPKDPTNPLDSQTVGPKGYLITLGSWLSSGLNQTGINPRKAHHEYAIRVGSKPFIVANANVKQEQIDAAICSEPKVATTDSTPSEVGAPATAAKILAVWCKLTIGESKTAILQAMGTPHGTAGASWMASHGISGDTAEWDNVSGDILFSAFQNGVAINLLAYAGAIGPDGATNLSCPAFRK